MGNRSIAAFDFDGTITTRDTLLPFLARTCGRRTFARALQRAGRVSVSSRVGSHHSGTHPRDASKAVLLRELFAGRSAAWLREMGASYAADVLPGQLRPEMVAQIQWHSDNGHELVLVSASLDAYLGPFGREHGFDGVIAVELESDDSGTLTGELTHPNVRGAQKALRLRSWLGDEDPGFMWAYGNSSGDRELLEMADQPVWVGRRRRSAGTTPLRPAPTP